MRGSSVRSKGVLTKPPGGGVNQPKASAVSKPAGSGAPRRQPSAEGGGSARVAYRSQQMADETRHMEEELQYIRKAKAKEKEADSERQKFSGGSNWSRSGTNTSLREYDKQFMSAAADRQAPEDLFSRRPVLSSSTGSRRSAKQQDPAMRLNCADQTSSEPLAKTKLVAGPAPAGLSEEAKARRPRGLFDMPSSLPKPPPKAHILEAAEEKPAAAPTEQAQPVAQPVAQQPPTNAQQREEEEEEEEEWIPAALQPPRKDPNAPLPAPSSRPFSAGFQRLLEQELDGQPAWTNPAESPQGAAGAGWVNPSDESAIDAELAAAEARVAELRRLKGVNSDAPAKPANSAGCGGWNNPADNAGGGWSNPADSNAGGGWSNPADDNSGGAGSLWGSYDESAQQNSFAQAVAGWRKPAEQPKPTGGGSLWGDYDENAQKDSFQDAMREWKGEPAGRPSSVEGSTANHTAVEARSATKASCYQCYKLFWSNIAFAIPAPASARTGELAALEEQCFCSEQCWCRAETKAKINDAKKARTQRIQSAQGSRPSSSAAAVKPPVPAALLDDDDDI